MTDVAYVNAVQFIARCPACDQDAEWTSRRVEHQIRTGVTYLAVGQRVTCTVECDCAP